MKKHSQVELFAIRVYKLYIIYILIIQKTQKECDICFWLGTKSRITNSDLH